MKAILVIDMPKSCGKCPLCYKEGDGYFTYRCIVDENRVDFKTLHEWCPLKPLPKTAEVPDDAYVSDYLDFDLGWNACLDTITGEKQRHTEPLVKSMDIPIMGHGTL